MAFDNFVKSGSDPDFSLLGEICEKFQGGKQRKGSRVSRSRKQGQKQVEAGSGFYSLTLKTFKVEELI